MSDPFIGQIKLFAGNFAPRGWAYCNGQLLDIASHSALFSILGTTYGGDGRVTLALPDLRGRAAIHEGNGPGLSNRPLGSRSGQATVTLLPNNLPSHTHALRGIATVSTTQAPAANTSLANTPASTGGGRGRGRTQSSGVTPYGPANNLVTLAGTASTGNSQSHSNIQPRLGVNYIIALIGTFPSPS